MKSIIASVLYLIVSVTVVYAQTDAERKGPIFNALIEEGIIFTENERVLFEYNDEEGFQEEEVIRDSNDNESIDLTEVLDFIMANADRTEAVQNVYEIVRTNSAYGPIREKVRTEYGAKLSEKIGRLRDADGVERIRAVAELIKRENELAAEMENAEKTLDSEKAEEIDQQLHQIYTMMSRNGYHPFAAQKIYYLPNGLRVTAEQVDFFDEGYIKTVTLQEGIEFTLPLGLEKSEARQLVSATQLAFDENGTLQWVSLAEPTPIYIPENDDLAIAVRLEFSEDGAIADFRRYGEEQEKSVTGEHRFDEENGPLTETERTGLEPVKMFFPDGAEGRVITLEDAGNLPIHYVDLSLPVSVVLPSGDAVTADMLAFDSKKRILLAHFTDNSSIELPGDFMVTGSGFVGFTADGEVRRLWPNGGAELTLPSGVTITLARTEWPLFDDGVFYDAEFTIVEEGLRSVVLPNGMEVDAEKLSLYDSGAVHTVELRDSREVDIPTGDRIFAKKLRFYPPAAGGSIRQVFISEQNRTISVVTLPTGERVVARNWISFSPEGDMIDIQLGSTDGEVELVLPDGTAVSAKQLLRFFPAGSLRQITFEQPEALEVPLPAGVRLLTVTGALFFENGRYRKVWLFEPTKIRVEGSLLTVREYITFSADGKVCCIR